jgi:hypothetical protein
MAITATGEFTLGGTCEHCRQIPHVEEFVVCVRRWALFETEVH